MTEPTDPIERQAYDLLRNADQGTTARERGYSHGGNLPGAPAKVEVLHLTPEHWQNVGGLRPDESLSDEDVDEERRAFGAYSDELPQGDIVVTIRFRGINPRSWLSGWDAEAMANYLVAPRRSIGTWNDQAWKRYLKHKAKSLPPQIPCAVCSRIFQPERRTARYCRQACSSQAARDRRKRQAN